MRSESQVHYCSEPDSKQDERAVSLQVLYILTPTGIFAGVERVVHELADELAATFANEISVDVLLTSDFPGKPTDNLHYKSISVRPKKGSFGLGAAVRAVVREKDYDLVVVPQIEATTLLWFACIGVGCKFALYLHGNPKQENTHPKANFFFFLFRAIVRRRLTAVFCISLKQLDYFKGAYQSDAPHFWVPNPVREFADTTPMQKAPDGTVTFVNVSRFCLQKGQDMLIRAFALVHAQRPGARLKVVGYGSEEKGITAQIAALGLSGAAQIEHHPHDPSAALRSGDVYVSSSRWEGWSLAICEALRFGLPVAATDCEFGPSDILIDPRLGRLSAAGDEAALAETMIHYFDNIVAEKAYADFRREYVRRFDVERVVHMHADAIRQAVGSNGKANLQPVPRQRL